MVLNMKKLSVILENCKSSGIKLQNYESDFLQSLFEHNLQGNYNLLLKSNVSFLVLKEFFSKSNIRYCDVKKNSYILEKLSNEFNDLLKEELGRNQSTPKFDDNNGYNISPEKIAFEKESVSITTGIEGENETLSIKSNNLGINVTKIFDDPEEAKLYSSNLSRKINSI